MSVPNLTREEAAMAQKFIRTSFVSVALLALMPLPALAQTPFAPPPQIPYGLSVSTESAKNAAAASIAEARREATDIPPEEIANAAQHLLGQHISLPLDDLVRETARLFGYQRTGQRVEPAIRRGITLLLTRQMAREEGGMVIHQPQ
jgi:hypothetical protein